MRLQLILLIDTHPGPASTPGPETPRHTRDGGTRQIPAAFPVRPLAKVLPRPSLRLVGSK